MSPLAPRRGSATLYTFLSLLLLILALTLRMIRPFLLAVLMGAILAIVAERAYQWLMRSGVRPKLASFFLTSAILLLILTPVFAFVLVAIRQALAFSEKAASMKMPTLEAVIETVSEWGPARFWIGDTVAIEDQIRRGLQSLLTQTTAVILSLATNLPALVLQVLLTCLSCYFFLIDGRAFIDWAANKVPMDWDVRNRLIESFKSTAVSVILASIASATIQAILIFVAFLVLGVQLPFLAAGATFILAWVPIIGSSPIWVFAVIYFYLQHQFGRSVAMFIFGLLIAVSDNVVRPWVLGGRSSLHPLVTLIAIFGGIELFGYFGVFVGPILMAVLISLLQVWPEVAQRFGLVLESGNSSTSTSRST